MDINVYDFDNTIYDGDSTVDFYMYCLKRKKSICKYWFKQGWNMFLYIIKIKEKTEMKQAFFSFLNAYENIDELVQEFWNKNYSKIKKWYLKKDHSNDVIISASPEFLLKIPCEKLKVKALIASDVDKKSGKFNGKNCYGDEKVNRLNKLYENANVIEAYSDSLSDLPLFNIANVSYIVKGEEISKYEK